MVGNLPGVLTVAAVAAGFMPPAGQSGLPASLEQDVPANYRFWKAGAHARAVRDALVEANLFTQETVLKLRSGETEEFRRVEKRLFLPDTQPDANTFSLPVPAAQYAATCLKYEAGRATYVYEQGQAPELADLQKSTDAWLIACADEEEALTELRKAKVVSIFKLGTRPGLLFASNVEVDPALAPHALLVTEVSKAEQLREEGLSKIRLLKASEKVEKKEERFVLGVVLEPEEVDSQEDIYNEEEIRKAAHGYLEGYRSGNYVGIQHAGVDYTSKIFVLESYIAPVDFEIPQPGGTVEKVKKGTWLMGFRVNDDATWTKVRKGEITGLSIGGSAIRTPEKKAPKQAKA